MNTMRTFCCVVSIVLFLLAAVLAFGTQHHLPSSVVVMLRRSLSLTWSGHWRRWAFALAGGVRLDWSRRIPPFGSLMGEENEHETRRNNPLCVR